ncbi:MAG TPA: SHOCT domain-containing protein [Solirubrobacterales bacterium]|nr:SHOCT domain-containing protein [Solirubrobacterales bacterium]HMX72530.1 SHOCT domain-containing protein [Solirubrobacterales bacterium]HNA45419.1 SHOCT domain-containing protein [Solirubrobacterales bacterium]
MLNILASYDLGDALLTTLAIFFFVIWIWIVITILMDIFRDHELSGWWKAVWVIFLIFIPFLTAFIYLIARGSGMRERAIKEQADAKKHFDEYVRETAQTTPVDELHKLDQLRQSGGITEDEYAKMKAKLIN